MQGNERVMIRTRYEGLPEGARSKRRLLLYRKLGIKRSFIKPRITDICPFWSHAKLSERPPSTGGLST